jgi:transcription initiation factor TFIIIB Brf1 subunit/transcription initiation factor TFIIB
MTDFCNHFTRLDDEHTGDEVCTDCGLILGAVYSHTLSAAANGNIRKEDPKQKIFFLDTCFNECLTEATATDSYNYYMKLRKHPKSRGFSNIDLAGFALYSCTTQACVGRSPQQIAAAVGANARRMCDLQDIFRQENVFDDAKHYVAPLRYHLDLTNSDEMVLRSWVAAMPLEGCRPQTLASAIVYIYCEQDNRRGRSPKEIAHAGGISVDSLSRTVKKLKMMYPMHVLKQ